MKIRKFDIKVRDGRTEPCTAMLAAGIVILETWGGENTYTLQWMTMQNGQTDVAFTDAGVDGPIRQGVVSCIRPNRHGLKAIVPRGHRAKEANHFVAEPVEGEDPSLTAIRRAVGLAFDEGFGDPRRGENDPRLTPESLEKVVKVAWKWFNRFDP